MTRGRFACPDGEQPAGVSADELRQFEIPGLPGEHGSTRVLVDGRYRADLSLLRENAGVTAAGLADALAAGTPALGHHLARHADFRDDAFNALGTVNPVRAIVELAHRRGAAVLIDGAQAVPHAPVDVQALGCDFYAFSGHKLYGPTGIGALYARADLLERMAPYQGGGDMIASVTFEKTTYNELPYRFEAGTPDIAGAVGLGAAIDYLQVLGLERVAAHEAGLLAYATDALSRIAGLRPIGTARHKAAVLSFVLDDIHPHDVGTVLDAEGVAVRTGHHCAQPVMDRFGVPATVRASLGLYNTTADIDALAAALGKVLKVFKP